MKISVFGASGFIGSNFQKYSIHDTEILDRNKPEATSAEVLYLIGTTDNYNVLNNAKLDIEVNLLLLIENLENLRKKFSNFTFTFVSSWFVYGDAQQPPFTEDGPCNPRGFYSISKYAAELYIKSYCETFNIRYRIIRLGNVFGQNDTGISKKKNALQYLFLRLRSNLEIELYDGGEFYRDYIDVRDVVSAIDLILDSNLINTTINIGSGEPVQFKELIMEAKRVFESNSNIIEIPVPEFHKIVQVKNSWLNTNKLTSLGFRPKYRILTEILNL